MKDAKIDMNKMKKAIEKFGSLDAANLKLSRDNNSLEEQNKEMTGKVAELQETIQGLSIRRSELNRDIDTGNREWEFTKSQIARYSFQYNLFTAFLAMVVSSPSVKDSTEKLIGLFQSLLTRGWYTMNSADELRTFFVTTVMGDYLKCYRCRHCGTQFIVNREANEYSLNNINCPVCHWPFRASADDSFLKVLVSGEQIDKVYRMEDLIKENALLKPLAPFLEVKCEICGNTIQDWTENNVQLAREGYGWGHDECWESDLGKMRLYLTALKKANEKQNKPETTKNNDVKQGN